MALPPNDVEPSELWRKLEESEPAEVVDFPRYGKDGKPIGQIRIKALRMNAHDDARVRAREKLRKKPRVVKEDFEGANIIREVEGDMVARELLWLACTVDTPKTRADGTEWYPQAFPNPEAIGERLTGDEIAVLFSSYLMIQQKYGPSPGSMTEEEIDKWIERLVEGGSALPLARLNSHQLAKLLWSLAHRNYTLCRTLESQRSNLPDTLNAALESLSFDISCFGTPQENSASTPESSGELAEQVITIEDAIEISKQFR